MTKKIKKKRKFGKKIKELMNKKKWPLRGWNENLKREQIFKEDKTLRVLPSSDFCSVL